MAEAILQEKDPRRQEALVKKLWVSPFDEEDWSKYSFEVVKRASLEKVILLCIFNILSLFYELICILELCSLAS